MIITNYSDNQEVLTSNKVKVDNMVRRSFQSDEDGEPPIEDKMYLIVTLFMIYIPKTFQKGSSKDFSFLLTLAQECVSFHDKVNVNIYVNLLLVSIKVHFYGRSCSSGIITKVTFGNILI